MVCSNFLFRPKLSQGLQGGSYSVEKKVTKSYQAQPGTPGSDEPVGKFCIVGSGSLLLFLPLLSLIRLHQSTVFTGKEMHADRYPKQPTDVVLFNFFFSQAPPESGNACSVLWLSTTCRLTPY